MRYPLHSSVRFSRLGSGLLALFCCAGLLPGGHAVEKSVVQDVILRNWDLDDGLPSTRVNAVARTPDGYLWLATHRGLVRFDGVRFVPVEITNIPPLQPRRVTCLLVDRKGAFWVGVNGQLLRQSGQAFVAVDLRNATAGRRLNALAEDAQGALWLASEGAGLVRIQAGQAEQFGTATGLPSANVSAVLCDPEGRMWAVAGGRLVTSEGGRWREPEGAPLSPEAVQRIVGPHHPTRPGRQPQYTPAQNPGRDVERRVAAVSLAAGFRANARQRRVGGSEQARLVRHRRRCLLP
jgi:hypothetical protein